MWQQGLKQCGHLSTWDTMVHHHQHFLQPAKMVIEAYAKPIFSFNIKIFVRACVCACKYMCYSTFKSVKSKILFYMGSVSQSRFSENPEFINPEMRETLSFPSQCRSTQRLGLDSEVVEPALWNGPLLYVYAYSTAILFPLQWTCVYCVQSILAYLQGMACPATNNVN